MKSAICIKYSEKKAGHTVKDDTCFTDKIYSESKADLREMFEDFQQKIPNSDYRVSAVCLDTIEGHQLCGTFLGMLPSATVEYSNSLDHL